MIAQQPPASVAAGSSFGLTVDVDDASGNLFTSFNGTVTVALANNPGGATLGGTLSVTASQGVATFSGLTLTKAASGYTLTVSSRDRGQHNHRCHYRDPRGGQSVGDGHATVSNGDGRAGVCIASP